MIFRTAPHFLMLLLCFSLLGFVGCAELTQKLDKNLTYKQDLKMNINGEEFVGVAVPKVSESYDIVVESPGEISNITFRSCHRDDIFKPKSRRWFSSSKKRKIFRYSYTPNELEKGRACLLSIGTYEKNKKGRHSWGTIDLDSKIENLPADIECNGEKWSSGEKSVSICQARTGSLQKVTFDHIVIPSQKLRSKCNVLSTIDEKTYTYVMPQDECTFYFGDRYGNFHRHTTFGYSTILIR